MTAWSEPAFAHIAELVARRTGLVFAPNRCERLENAVRHTMVNLALADVAAFARTLAASAALWDVLIAQMTVGETYFFRNNEHFEFLRQSVLPELAERCGPQYRPRVWSAGCASGEEAYSLAIALEEQGKLSGAFVLGTDLNRAALERARLGRYNQWSLRGLDPKRLEKYFGGSKSEVVLSPRLRDKVTFTELNLAGVGYPSTVSATFSMDLILCRNVLIYLGPEAIASVAQRLYASLAPGGYLITGPSDPLLSYAGFEVLNVPAGVAYRRPLSAAFPVRVDASEIPASSPPPRSSVSVRPTAIGLTDREGTNDSTRLALRARDQQAHHALAASHAQDSWLSLAALRARCQAAPAEVTEAECRAALARLPLTPELHYLHALSLLNSSQPFAAAAALRRAIYLDANLAIVHFTLGSVLAGLNDHVGAERAYRNAEQCADRSPASEPVPLAREICAEGLARAAARELKLLRARSAAQ